MRIVISLKDNADEVFEKQVNMMKERHKASELRLELDEAVEYFKSCSFDDIFISDDEDLLSKAKEAGIATNNPKAMRESYMKAMEMLKSLGMNAGKEV